MNKRITAKLSSSLDKPKRTFKTIQVRPEVLVLLSETQDAFAEHNEGVRPQNSITFINALSHYKAFLLAQAKSLSYDGKSSGPNGQ